MSFSKALTDAAARVQGRLDAALADREDLPVVHAMRYAVQGGKRLRGFLVLESARLHGIAPEAAVSAAALSRRCMPTASCMTTCPAWTMTTCAAACRPCIASGTNAPPCWRATRCRLSPSSSWPIRRSDPPRCGSNWWRALRKLGRRGHGAGPGTRHRGRDGCRAPHARSDHHLQAGKTGALIRWSAEAGAILGQADRVPLRRYATALGLAFQIADDILDVEGDAEKAGKRLQKDAEAGKATFVSLLGLDGAKRGRGSGEDAEAALAPYGPEAGTLIEAARFVISRES